MSGARPLRESRSCTLFWETCESSLPQTRRPLTSVNSFGARGELTVGERTFETFRLDALAPAFEIGSLPFSLKILLENLLRTEGNGAVLAADVEALAGW